VDGQKKKQTDGQNSRAPMDQDRGRSTQKRGEKKKNRKEVRQANTDRRDAIDNVTDKWRDSQAPQIATREIAPSFYFSFFFPFLHLHRWKHDSPLISLLRGTFFFFFFFSTARLRVEETGFFFFFFFCSFYFFPCRANTIQTLIWSKVIVEIAFSDATSWRRRSWKWWKIESWSVQR